MAIVRRGGEVDGGRLSTIAWQLRAWTARQRQDGARGGGPSWQEGGDRSRPPAVGAACRGDTVRGWRGRLAATTHAEGGRTVATHRPALWRGIGATRRRGGSRGGSDGRKGWPWPMEQAAARCGGGGEGGRREEIGGGGKVVLAAWPATGRRRRAHTAVVDMHGGGGRARLQWMRAEVVDARCGGNSVAEPRAGLVAAMSTAASAGGCRRRGAGGAEERESEKGGGGGHLLEERWVAAVRWRRRENARERGIGGGGSF